MKKVIILLVVCLMVVSFLYWDETKRQERYDQKVKSMVIKSEENQ